MLDRSNKESSWSHYRVHIFWVHQSLQFAITVGWTFLPCYWYLYLAGDGAQLVQLDCRGQGKVRGYSSGT